jgi:hypothetical protein
LVVFAGQSTKVWRTQRHLQLLDQRKGPQRLRGDHDQIVG